MPTITIFGSGRVPSDSPLYRDAVRLGRLLAERGFTVCTGGYGGTMEAASRGASEAGGEVVGVLLEAFGPEPNPFAARVEVAPDLLTRINSLIGRADGYVILPGGTGTLAEIGVLLEFMNKGFIPVRPVVFLGQAWRPLLDILVEDEHVGCYSFSRFSLQPGKGPIVIAATAEETVEILARTVRHA